MNIHILAIAGKMTAPLAVELKRQGHLVSGSDQNLIYPPISTLLKKHKICINQTKISKKIDLVIVGSSFNKFLKTRQEYNQAKKLNIATISATNYIAKNLVKDNSIIIAGSYGKTTITGLVSLILINAKLDPSYLIGEATLNKIPSLKISKSNWSVVEGDESINGLDTKAKFLYYQTKYLILTSTSWEHKESYKSQKDNLTAYKKLITSLPKNGVLVYNNLDKSLKNLIKYSKAPSIGYNNNLKFDTPLIGGYNQKNIAAAYTLAKFLNLDESIIKKTIKSYLGIPRRLQVLANYQNILFIDDFAQSPLRIKSALDSIKKEFPKREIIVFFEAHASFLLYKDSLEELKESFKHAQKIILAKIPYKKDIDQKDRLTFKHIKNTFGQKVVYLPIYHQIYQYLTQNLSSKQILVHMSSGGGPGIKTLSKTIRHFKKLSNKG